LRQASIKSGHDLTSSTAVYTMSLRRSIWSRQNGQYIARLGAALNLLQALKAAGHDLYKIRL
jgi:hypothetical protein